MRKDIKDPILKKYMTCQYPTPDESKERTEGLSNILAHVPQARELFAAFKVSIKEFFKMAIKGADYYFALVIMHHACGFVLDNKIGMEMAGTIKKVLGIHRQGITDAGKDSQKYDLIIDGVVKKDVDDETLVGLMEVYFSYYVAGAIFGEDKTWQEVYEIAEKVAEALAILEASGLGGMKSSSDSTH